MYYILSLNRDCNCLTLGNSSFHQVSDITTQENHLFSPKNGVDFEWYINEKWIVIDVYLGWTFGLKF